MPLNNSKVVFLSLVVEKYLCTKVDQANIFETSGVSNWVKVCHARKGEGASITHQAGAIRCLEPRVRTTVYPVPKMIVWLRRRIADPALSHRPVRVFVSGVLPRSARPAKQELEASLAFPIGYNCSK